MASAARTISIKSFGATTLCYAVGIISGVASGVALARSLGPSGRGELAEALLWPWILVLIADMGLGFSFSYHAGKLQSRFDDLWTLAVASGAILGGLGTLAGFLIIPLVTRGWVPEAREAMQIALFSVPCVVISGYQAYLLLGSKLLAEFNAVKLVNTVAYLVAVLTITVSGHSSVRHFALGYVLSQAFSLVFCSAIIRWRFKPAMRLTFDLIPRLASYALKTQVSSLSAQANLRLDQTVMSFLFSPSQLGQYVVAVAISGVLGPFFNALAIVILPQTTHAPDTARGAILTAKQIKLAAVLSAPLLVLAIIAMPRLLPLFFGTGYAAAVVPAQILVAASLFQGLTTVLGNSLRGLGRPSDPAIAEGLGMLFTCVLLYVLLGSLGVSGAAVASLGAYASVCIAELLFLARAAGLSLKALMKVPIEFGALQRILPSVPGGK